MSTQQNNQAKKGHKNNVKSHAPRVPFAIIKKQQNLWSWLEFHTRLSVGGPHHRAAAERARLELEQLHADYPALYKPQTGKKADKKPA